MKKKQLLLSMLMASVFGGAIALGGFMIFGNKTKVYQTVQQNAPVQYSDYYAMMPAELNFVQSAEIVRPSVVHVKTYKEVDMNSYNRRYQNNDPFEYFFRDFFGQQPQRKPQPQQKPEENLQNRPMGFGSGVIISVDGYIVTNNHVINDADNIEIVLDDKRSYEAKVIGTDPTTDLALLKIDEKELPFINFSNSDAVRVGEWVLAVGNPFNLNSTVTAGIVSAKARNINIIRNENGLGIESFIQTDAAVNPGNSGGALVDVNGGLIGINTAIQSKNGSFTGYAFAIPSSIAKKVIGDLKEYGVVQRALLGVNIRTMDAELAEEKDLNSLKGVYVVAVGENSAAEDASLKEGDVITAIDGKQVNTTSELQELVAQRRPGDDIKVTFVRDTKKKTETVTLKNTNGETALVKKEFKALATALGADLESLSKKELKKLNLEGGVKVSKINPGKLRRSGLAPGFIITHIDKKAVSNPNDAAKILEHTENNGRGVLIEGIYPSGKKAYYAIGW